MRSGVRRRIFFYGFIVCIFLSAGFLVVLFKDLPSVASFDERKVAQSSKIYDRTGKVLLYEIHGEEKRTIIPFSEIPRSIQLATLAIEDVDFYTHGAVDWKSIVRAIFANITSGGIVQGGSTITQQLAKNAFLSPDRTIVRKLRELILAVNLEQKYTKDQILALYLNQIPYGANSYGVEAASQTYFGKSVSRLSLAQTAVLASLPKAPSYYSPWGTHKSALMNRKNTVIDRMLRLGFITESDAEAAKKESIVIFAQLTDIKAPHFVMAVLDYLHNQYGEALVRTGGLRVTTTLDWDMQQVAERLVAEGAKRNSELYEGKNAALIAEDPKTGQILALVGSRDYFDTEIDGQFNVATQGLRQPGSTIKPFVYLKAFQEGYTPDTVVFDLETEFETSDDVTKSYRPQNFDEKFLGPITFKEALAQSRNIPAVKALYLVGLDDVLRLTKSFGISTLTERSRYGLSLVLGGGEVKLNELVSAYAVLSQEGVSHRQSLLLKIEDAKNHVLEGYEDKKEQVVEPEYPRLINNILSDVELRRPLFQNSLRLTTFENHEVALKTGTTNDYHDAWAIGYTPSLVVGVWAGNNDNTPMVKHGTSILAAVPIWSAFMNAMIAKIPSDTFTKPEPVLAEKPMLRGVYVVNNQVHDLLYYVDKNNPRGDAPEHPEDDGQFKNWEDPVITWLQAHPLTTISNIVGAPIAQKGITVQITNPTQGAFIKDNVLVVSATIYSPNDIVRTDVRLNDAVPGNSFFEEFRFSGMVNDLRQYQYTKRFIVRDLRLQNSLQVNVVDTQGNTGGARIIVFR